jgi:hypothetical protein
MLFRIPNPNRVDNPGPVSLRCPGCKQQGTFPPFAGVNDAHHQNYSFGQRRCPNPDCHLHVFVVQERGKLLVAYPAERIDFDSTNLPPAVVAALEEAITCHASRCFVAAAIMVRKTLEELCHDRGATGPNLKARLSSLGTKVVLPIELLDALDHLRLLGNDAAHIESREYQQVGQEEVEVGLILTKEVLKSVYQYSALLGRLKALRKEA